MKKIVLLSILVVLAAGAIYVWSRHDIYYHPPHRQKVAECVIRHALPDPECSPGAVDTTASLEEICSRSTDEVRHTSVAMVNMVFRAYNMSRDDGVAREDDHLIPLWLGGKDNDPANHWPQHYEDERMLEAGLLTDDELGAHAKDKVEDWLHNRVCKESLPLAEAQRMIATNWVAVYHDWLNRPKPIRHRRKK